MRTSFLATQIYNIILLKSEKRFVIFIQKIFKKIRAIVVLYSDPICKIKVNNQYMKMPFSHNLSLYKDTSELFDSILGRLSGYLRMFNNKLVYIDVGANIGGTICFFEAQSNDRIIAIEPAKKIF